jgi:hypothetical protein
MRKNLKMASLPLFILLSVSLSVTPVLASHVKERSLSWVQGWDNFSGTLNPFPASRLFFSAHGSQLNIRYVLSGSNIVNTMLAVGIVSVLPSTSNCIPTIGTITSGTGSSGSTFNSGPVLTGNCETITRQGVTASEQQFPVGSLAMDSSGSAFLNVTISGVPQGEYDLVFSVYSGPFLSPMVFQSPGAFGDTTSVRVHKK